MVYASALVGREGEGYILNYESDRAAHTLDFIIVHWFCGDGKSPIRLARYHFNFTPLYGAAGYTGGSAWPCRCVVLASRRAPITSSSSTTACW